MQNESSFTPLNNKKIQYFYVGGTVRDKLLNLKQRDIDMVAIGCTFDELCIDIESRGGQIFLKKEQFLTVRCMFPDIGPCDIRIAREDGGYTDGRRPDDVKIASTLLADSYTRDFTVNAIYKNMETGEIIDYHNGREDLREMKLKCVGVARERFEEDLLRLLRAMRFKIVKDFWLDDDINDCLHDYELVRRIKVNVSRERCYEELKKCFEHDTWKTLIFLDFYKDLRDTLFRDKNYGVGLTATCYQIKQ